MTRCTYTQRIVENSKHFKFNTTDEKKTWIRVLILQCSLGLSYMRLN